MNTTQIKNGVVSGLAGGMVFGMMMAMMGMLPMIGKMAGFPNAWAGFVVHMGISASIGGSFALLAGGRAKTRIAGFPSGLGYGAIWWVLGPPTLMPLMMGMGFGVNWNLSAASSMLPSLMGHMIFGVIMGLAYFQLGSRGSVATSKAKFDTVRGSA